MSERKNTNPKSTISDLLPGVAALIVALVGGGGIWSLVQPKTHSVKGLWTWKCCDKYSGVLELQQNDKDISGRIQNDDQNWEEISGTIDGDNVSFIREFNNDQNQIYTLKLSSDKKALKGNISGDLDPEAPTTVFTAQRN